MSVTNAWVTESLEKRRALLNLAKTNWLALIAGSSYFLVLACFATLLGTWTDEEYSLATTAHGLLYAWNRAIDYEVQAPLYFVALTLWRHANESVWFARLLSIVCATGFFFALIPLLRRVAPARNPVWPSLLIALNPFVIYYAFDIRLYAPALLISALTYNAFEDGFARDLKLRSQLSFVALSIVGLYTQYLLGFAFIGYFAILVVRGRMRSLVPYTLALTVTAVAALPIVQMLRSQVGKSGEATGSSMTLLQQALLHPWLEFLLPYDRNLDALHLHWPHMVLIVTVAALVVYARPHAGVEVRAAVACAALVELSLVAAVLLVRLDLAARHYVVLFVPVMVAGYATFVAVARMPTASRLIFWSFMVLNFSALYVQQYHVAQSGDTKRIGAFFDKSAGPGSVIAIYPADALAAYKREYHGVARLVAFPNALPPDRYDIDAIEVHNELEARRSLLKLLPARRVWLVMFGACPTGWQHYGCQYVLAAMHHDNRVLREYDFYDSRVFALVLGRQPIVLRSSRSNAR